MIRPRYPSSRSTDCRAPQFVSMLWRYANLFQHISDCAASRGLPKRALRAAAVAQALEDLARSETDGPTGDATEGSHG